MPRSGGSPSTAIVPSARCKPASARSNVVFPAPLRPTIATTSPPCAQKSRLCSTSVSSRRTLKPRTSSVKGARFCAGGGIARAVSGGVVGEVRCSVRNPGSSSNHSRRCSHATIAVPCAANPASAAVRSAAASPSSIENGSSSTNTAGRRLIMLASANRCCSPPERLRGSRLRSAANPNCARTSSSRVAISARAKPRFSSPKMSSFSVVVASICAAGF